MNPSEESELMTGIDYRMLWTDAVRIMEGMQERIDELEQLVILLGEGLSR